MQAVNRTRFTAKFLRKLRNDLRSNLSTVFIKKYKPTLKNSTVTIFGREVVPENSIERILDKATRETAAGLGIRSLQRWVQERYIGISRSAIANYLQSDETLASIQTRPAGSVPGRQRKNHGVTANVIAKYPNILGADTIHVARSWDAPIRYILMVVHLRTGYPWAYQMKATKMVEGERKLTLSTKEVAQKIGQAVRDCTKRFGFPERLQTDPGSEFKDHVLTYLAKKGITHIALNKENTVERKNSVFQRYLVFTKKHMGWDQAFTAALRKVRALQNSVTGKAPAEVSRYDKLPRTYRKDKGWEADKPSFEVGSYVKYIKRSARNAVLHKSYEPQSSKSTWSAPFLVKKKHADRYFLDGQWFPYYNLRKAVKRKARYTDRPASPAKAPKKHRYPLRNRAK